MDLKYLFNKIPVWLKITVIVIAMYIGVLVIISTPILLAAGIIIAACYGFYEGGKEKGRRES